jgi:hypothetical protein
MSLRIMATVGLLSLSACPGQAYGFLPTDDEPSASEPPTKFQFRDATTHVTLQGSRQWNDLPGSSLNLTGSGSLIGNRRVSPEKFLATLAPELAPLTAHTIKSHSDGLVHHESFELRLGNWPIFGSRLDLHHVRDQLVMYKAQLPRISHLDLPPQQDDFKSLEELNIGTLTRNLTHMTSSQGLAVDHDTLIPAWSISGWDEFKGAKQTILVDAIRGTVVHESSDSFKFANVYQVNPRHGTLIRVDLSDLLSTSLLDGLRISVYAPDSVSPRAIGSDRTFDFNPEVPSDAVHFDEAQTYFSATEALKWFENRFGTDFKTLHLKIRINDDMAGRPDNAFYLPDPAGPEIRIGRGDKLRNLGRDKDVIYHEIAHHIIYSHIQATTGDSGILHEGTADYFAYAMSDDPYLAESVSPTAPYIRTAVMSNKADYDLLPVNTKTHIKGSYWSALLWALRSKLGSKQGDQLVYRSLDYLSPDANLREAILALLSADRDLADLETPGYPAVYGPRRCFILETATVLGFHQAIEEMDGTACGLDLKNLGNESRREAAGLGSDPSKKSQLDFKTFGKSCSTIGVDGFSHSTYLILVCLPLVLGIWNRKRYRQRRFAWNSKKSSK